MSIADLPLAHRNLPLLLQQARECVISRFRPLLNAQRITEQQWRIVRLLLESGPLEPRQIGEACNISSPSLAGVLARMHNMGLIDRQRFDTDQRRVSVSLNARSRALAERLAPQIEAVYADIEARVGVEFTRRLYAMLDELMATLDADEDEDIPVAAAD
ncbi:MAG: homoprotocatechuate degradation operon regulator HpaR [Gammaproteobacteria bacterium]|nr:homoprotocatechuate degradation operon regulator HpaR [Gammaproteobacteria bacterium]